MVIIIFFNAVDEISSEMDKLGNCMKIGKRKKEKRNIPRKEEEKSRKRTRRRRGQRRSEGRKKKRRGNRNQNGTAKRKIPVYKNEYSKTNIPRHIIPIRRQELSYREKCILSERTYSLKEL